MRRRRTPRSFTCLAAWLYDCAKSGVPSEEKLFGFLPFWWAWFEAFDQLLPQIFHLWLDLLFAWLVDISLDVFARYVYQIFRQHIDRNLNPNGECNSFFGIAQHPCWSCLVALVCVSHTFLYDLVALFLSYYTISPCRCSSWIAPNLWRTRCKILQLCVMLAFVESVEPILVVWS